jgi:site-specific DNA-methyltransferase (adenine-specific)
MEGMKRFPDKFFELAVVDPCYMEGFDVSTWTGILAKQKAYKKKTKTLEIKSDEVYFKELFRVSKNQIIWGGNYFILPISRGWVVWNKDNGIDNYFSDCELAWTSFDKILKMFSFKWQGMLQQNMSNKEQRIHPTQKPIALYKWLLQNYAKLGNRILDTHLGSQSSRIAAYKLGFDFWGWDIDKEYFDQGCARFEKAIAMPLFDEQPELTQNELFN